MSSDLATTAKSASTKTFETALVFNAAVFAAELLAFTLLRTRFKSIYEPRTFQPPKSKRMHPLSDSIFLWPIALLKSDYHDIIHANGMDAYFFVRFLRFMVKVFAPIWIISWIVLLPATSVGSQVGSNSGLDLFTFGNIESTKKQQTRYAAHIILVYLFTGWVFFNIKNEMRHFTITRQQHLIAPAHAKSVQANTILVTGIPAKYLNKQMLVSVFKHLPGGVKKVWINRDLGDLPDIYDRRMAATGKLESAETSLLKTAAKLRLKAVKGKSAAAKDADPERQSEAELVPRDKRPAHKLGSIPFMGQKVDTIEWAREEIRVTTELIEEARTTIRSDKAAEMIPSGGRNKQDKDDFAQSPNDANGDAEDEVAARHQDAPAQGSDIAAKTHTYPPMNSAFITFHSQIAAHMSQQVLTHHEPYRMSGKHVEISPDDVIWSNLGLNPYEAKVRTLVSYAATSGLILLWAFPVAFVGTISNISKLANTYKWLSWLNKIPSVPLGIIQGILPPVALAVLMMLLPIVLRLLIRFEGVPTRTGVELSLMNRFFVFQVIHSFLIVTLASGIIAALPDLAKNPSSVAGLLATNLPLSSTFFLTYIILQGLSGVAGGFFQIVPLAIYYVKLFILSSTPRKIWGIKYGPRSVAWGTLFPNITLLTTIAFGYSIISPIINGLACFCFFIFFQLYKYLFLWVFQQPSTTDTGGLFFPKAIQHTFVGLYVQQVCLAALFFLARDENKKASAVPEGALMIVLIIFTICFQMLINNSYGPLIHALPLSLADKTHGVATAAVGNASDSPGKSDSGLDSTSVEMAERGRPYGEHDLLAVNGAPGGRTSDVRGESEPVEKTETYKTISGRVLDEEEYGYHHPAVSRPQRIVWLPKDTLGMAEEEARNCREAGVDVSIENAEMNEKGKIDISGPPPDYVEDM